MYKQITIEEALKLNNPIFIDVRSPKEYQEASIPGSINIPILNNEEREVIGKIYKHEGKEKAISQGVKIVSEKLDFIYHQLVEICKEYKEIVFYCWRGGMRSAAICNIFSFVIPSNVYQLKGGYKSYRKLVNNFFEEGIDEFNFIVISGLTGVGKTKIINKLGNLGIQTIDLEGLANNAGSVFGKIPFNSPSPSQKDFEAFLFEKFYSAKNNYFVLESESKKIGKVSIPLKMFEKIEKGVHILVKTNIKNRVENIYNDYILNNQSEVNKEDIIVSIQHLRKRLGNNKIDSLIYKINNDEYRDVIQFLIEEYYDPLYKYSMDKLEKYNLVVEYEEIEEAVEKIFNFISRLIKEGVTT